MGSGRPAGAARLVDEPCALRFAPKQPELQKTQIYIHAWINCSRIIV